MASAAVAVKAVIMVVLAPQAAVTASAVTVALVLQVMVGLAPVATAALAPQVADATASVPQVTTHLLATTLRPVPQVAATAPHRT